MIGETDYVGIAAVIAALTGLVAAVGVIVNGRTAAKVHTAVKTENGQTLGQLVENTASQQAAELGMQPGEAQPSPSSGSTTSPSSG